MIKPIYQLLAALLLFVNLPCYAQNLPGRNCATNAVNARLAQKDPQFALDRQALEAQIRRQLQHRPTLRTQQIIEIPVVFHVLYNAPAENVSESQLRSQIAVLNEDFNRQNADATNTPAVFQGVAGNAQIRFCLASLDPKGQLTNGITRTATRFQTFSHTSDDMKYDSTGGKTAWNRDLYLNIWICNLDDNVLGFAQFPGGAAATDGVVIYYRTIGRAPQNPFPGPYNQGRTATHEIGHWLGLRHIWGDNENSCLDTDFIDDTPNQASQNEGCQRFPKISCGNGPNGDMFMNFMDYSNDNCMNLFTKGQAAYMHAVLNGFRQPLLLSNACSNALNADFRAEPDAINPGQSTDYYYFSNGRWPSTFLWQFEGGQPATSTEANPKGIRYDREGAFTVTLTVTDATETDTKTKTSYLKVTDENLQLYPNPAQNILEVGAPAGYKLRKVEIFTPIGKLLSSYAAEGRTLRLPVAHLANGLYLVRGTTEYGDTFSRQLVIMR